MRVEVAALSVLVGFCGVCAVCLYILGAMLSLTFSLLLTPTGATLLTLAFASAHLLSSQTPPTPPSTTLRSLAAHGTWDINRCHLWASSPGSTWARIDDPASPASSPPPLSASPHSSLLLAVVPVTRMGTPICPFPKDGTLVPHSEGDPGGVVDSLGYGLAVDGSILRGCWVRDGGWLLLSLEFRKAGGFRVDIGDGGVRGVYLEVVPGSIDGDHTVVTDGFGMAPVPVHREVRVRFEAYDDAGNRIWTGGESGAIGFSLGQEMTEYNASVEDYHTGVYDVVFSVEREGLYTGVITINGVVIARGIVVVLSLSQAHTLKSMLVRRKRIRIMGEADDDSHSYSYGGDWDSVGWEEGGGGGGGGEEGEREGETKGKRSVKLLLVPTRCFPRNMCPSSSSCCAQLR